jgi:alcohol dehydrogenase class IV
MIWRLQKTLYRIAHLIMGIMVKRLKVPEPELFTGPDSVLQLPAQIKQREVKKALLVTDKGITSIGLIDALLKELENAGIDCAVFDGVQPNPTIDNIETGLKAYQAEGCDGIIAFGGGSAMDCAKMIGARSTNPEMSVFDMRGGFKISKALPPLFAVPTTAGTGSECTLAAVVTDPANHEKFSVASLEIIPVAAVLDPALMMGLPPHITAHTGMDALTHAVEAYIGRIGTPYTDEHAEKAVRILFEDLEAVYQNGQDLERRSNVAMASYCAGLAFTRALIGYVHAIAHNLGGLYGVPHGLANAIVLPYILEFSRPDCETKLARLARAGGLGEDGESDRDLSFRFIEKVKEMNRNMGIPTTVAEMEEKDIPLIAARALKEGNPGYPVPTLMNKSQCEALLRKLL